MIRISSYVIFISVLSSSLALKANFRHEDINWSDMKNKAIWAAGLIRTSQELTRQAPKITKFLNAVAIDPKLLAVNPALAATTIYFTGVLAASYYYSVEAKTQLLKAQHKQDDVTMIIETEVLPNIKLLEKILSSGNLERFCDPKVKDSYRNQLSETVESLKNIREDIYRKIEESSSGALTNKVLQYVTGTTSLGTAAVAAAAGPCVATAMLACPQVIAGIASATSAIGFWGFRSNKLTHEETLTLLNSTRITLYEAEKTYRLARSMITTTCLQYDVNMLDINNMMKSLDVFVPENDKLKLEHENEEL